MKSLGTIPATQEVGTEADLPLGLLLFFLPKPILFNKKQSVIIWSGLTSKLMNLESLFFFFLTESQLIPNVSIVFTDYIKIIFYNFAIFIMIFFFSWRSPALLLWGSSRLSAVVPKVGGGDRSYCKRGDQMNVCFFPKTRQIH